MLNFIKHHPLANHLVRRPPLFYRAARMRLRQARDMQAHARRAWMQAMLARTLAAARKLPGYANAPASDDLAHWPLLTKSALMGREGDFVQRSLMPIIPAATGGSTGQPMKLARTWRSIAFEQATIDDLCAMHGNDARRARIAVLRGDSIKPAGDMKAPFWIDEGPARRIFSAHHLSRETIRHYRAALASFQPEILFCYPSSLAALLALLEDDDRLAIRLVFASSEVMARETVQRARALMGADVIDFYGHAERIACAYAVNGGEFRFVPGYGHIELIPEGNGLARIIATSLVAKGTILVRYDTGDLARVPSHDAQTLDEIALGLRGFGGIDGRDSEFVEITGGRRIIGLNHIPRGVEGAACVQLRQTAPDEMRIYVTPANPSRSFGERRLMENFREKFPSTVSAFIVLVERPVRERNGKAPLLLRAPDEGSIVPLPLVPSYSTETVR